MKTEINLQKMKKDDELTCKNQNGLVALKEIELKWQYGVFTFIPNFKIIEKELKALEIIAKKGIDIIELRNCKKAKTYNENTKRTYCEEYTDEEFDLLKEVLS